MDFTLTEEQVLIRESLSKAFQTDYDFDKRRAVLEDAATFHSPAMWSTIAESGFTGLLAPEDSDGFGGGAAELMVVAEELARHLSLEPFLSSAVMAIRLLDLASDAAERTLRMPGLLSGEQPGAVALYEPGERYAMENVATTAVETGEGWRLNGAKAVVIGADAAAWIAVSAKLEGDDVDIFVVETDANGVKRNPYRLVDGRGAADLELKDVVVPLSARLTSGGDAVAILSEVEDWAVLTMAAESLGAMECAKDLTLEYLKTRQQFGQPIGSFQVLQHDMANILSEVEYARSMVYWAAAAMAGDDPITRRHTISGAKAYIDKAARFVAEKTVQMHGGVGVTDEYALSHYVKRLTLTQILFGDRDEHLTRFLETA
ncbi:MAG: pimeloyl-CoA dehydrogenase small subunit [Rhodospirillaceae bacterium]|nr:pimeloyl-CoA dehydrogenase small subunit [Rhodospirillaceae bacterium]MBT6607057.1 pimeloyl-CoA dehydrogenase small subunit [Rhodospirillaceae bacterium]MBT6883449.1 pimeloyl-CoA dehydrogenase small subunit [Rhodospirillaceae bacterium]